MASVREILQAAIDRNNYGVKEFESGRIDEAIITFRDVLKHIKPFASRHLSSDLKRAMRRVDGSNAESFGVSYHIYRSGGVGGPMLSSQSSPSSSSYSNSSPSSTMSGANNRPREAFLPRLPYHTLGIRDTFEPHSVPYIFSDLASISTVIPRRDDMDRLRRHGANVATVVALNLAVSHHFHAIKQQSSKHLRNAQQLYECVFWMHIEDHSDMTVLVSLAVLNNLGHVYRELNDHSRSEQCLQQMLSTMMFLLESGDAEKIATVQWQGFLSSTWNIIFPCSGAVAAAA